MIADVNQRTFGIRSKSREALKFYGVFAVVEAETRAWAYLTEVAASSIYACSANETNYTRRDTV